MTIFHYWTFFVSAFWIFWTYWVLKSKKSKMPSQKSSIMKNGHFIIIYPALIKNLKKKSILEISKNHKKSIPVRYILYTTLYIIFKSELLNGTKVNLYLQITWDTIKVNLNLIPDMAMLPCELFLKRQQKMTHSGGTKLIYHKMNLLHSSIVWHPF